MSETLFLRVSHFFPSVLERTHVTDRRTHDGPSCMTVMMVRDPSPKGLYFFPSVLQRPLVTDRRTYDGPSCMTVITVRDPSPKGLHIFSQVSYDGHLQWTVVTVTVRPAHTVMLVRDSPSGFSIYTESKYNTTDLMTVHHSHDEPSPGPSCVTVSTEITYCFISYGFACLVCHYSY